MTHSSSKYMFLSRPRRFGKSLLTSTLHSYFSGREELFRGLAIEKLEKEWTEYPVLHFDMSTAKHTDKDKLVQELSLKLFEYEQIYGKLNEEVTPNQRLEGLIKRAYEQTGKKVVVLIDEYDVPLAKAHENGFYDEMALLIRNLFGNVLKTNESLAFAVLTGCLRIAKESIFTGLNNFKVYSITDKQYDEAFGFTNSEVHAMLCAYGLDDHFDEVKEWYDGYRFGEADVYCPWDVVNYCDDHIDDPNSKPKNYWMNTSGNDVINHFIDSINDPGMVTKTELEQLVNGGTIIQKVDEMVTYKDLYSNIDNLWSTLFMTGYLTQRGQVGDGYYCLAVPNREICNIIIERVLTLFRKEVSQNGELFRNFCNALTTSNASAVERLLTDYMSKTISVRDNFAKSLHENFYHGLMIGILGYRRDWKVLSNRESGDGFSDILIEINDSDANVGLGIVIELKYSSEEKDLELDCCEALKQIKNKNYTQELRNRGFNKIIKYGISFCRKKCRVMTIQE